MVLYIPFLLLIGGKTTSVSEAMDAFYKLIRGFTWMYMDILQLIDPALLAQRVIHCGGEVFEECSSTFLLILWSASVAPLGFHCSCFHWPAVPRKLSKYSSLVPSSGSSFIPWRQYQFLINLQNRWKCSYCLVVCQSNVGGFNASVGAPGLRALRASARAAKWVRSWHDCWDKKIPIHLWVYTVPVSRWPLWDIVTPTALQWCHLYGHKCLCNVPMVWHSSGLFYGAVVLRGPGSKQNVFIEVWWSPGGMKSKGNTHQDSCIVQCPTFLCLE